MARRTRSARRLSDRHAMARVRVLIAGFALPGAGAFAADGVDAVAADAVRVSLASSAGRRKDPTVFAIQRSRCIRRAEVPGSAIHPGRRIGWIGVTCAIVRCDAILLARYRQRDARDGQHCSTMPTQSHTRAIAHQGAPPQSRTENSARKRGGVNSCVPRRGARSRKAWAVHEISTRLAGFSQ